MARLSHRATEDYRSTYQSYGLWRERIGRIRSGNSVAAGVRFFSKTHHFRLGSGAHCMCLGSAEEAPWIRKLCGARRRFGRGHLYGDGETRTSRITGNSHQLPWDYSIRHCEGAPVRRFLAIRLILRRKAYLRAIDQSIHEETCLRTNDGDSPANAVRIGGFACLPGSLAVDHGDGYGQPAAPITSAVLGRTINGHSAGDLTRDDVLDDFTLYWLTNTAISAARFYWEQHLNLYVSIATAVSVFPGENYQAPRSVRARSNN